MMTSFITTLKKLMAYLLVSFMVLLTITACSAEAASYKLIKWDDLLTKQDLDALTKAPITTRVEDGSIADKIDSPLAMSLKNPQGEYEKALVSVKVRNEMNGRKVKLPGFIVPIDLVGEGKTKTFFFVPYFGACLHLPPPPPNQIIYAHYPKGYTVKDMNQPYYIEATLYTKLIKNEMATAAYTAKVDKIYLYK